MRGYFMGARDSGDTVARVIRLARLALGGAVVGAAIAGLFSKTVGTTPDHVSALGAVGGAIAVALIKCAHLI